MNIKQELGARIKELRHKKGYTQEKFAEAIGVAPRHISRIENGINTPSIETLAKIADILDVEIKELYNFQHLKNEYYLKESLLKLINELDYNGLSLANKVLQAIFK